jgi:Peptidase family C25/Secretion system C-terminal sorting domain
MKIVGFLLIASVAASISESYAGNLRDSANQADYVVISPASYFPIAGKLASFRHDHNGFSTMVVNIDSIMAQFGASVSPDTALKNFIQFTLNNWSSPKPQYFVLAGNINVIPSHPDSETIPLQGAYDTLLMIDQWYVQTSMPNGAVQIGACLGRLPAWDSTDLSVMVNKTIKYETDTAGVWCNRAISLADYREEDGNIFEFDAKELRSYLDSLWTDTISVDIRTDSPNHLDTTGFVDLWNQGAAIVSYLGHADEVQFSYSRYFTTWSIDSLTNRDRLSVCLLGGCDLTFDTGPDLSIPTHLLEHKGGGAVAVISSEGVNYEWPTLSFYESVIQSILASPDAPIGKAYENAMVRWTGDVTGRFTFLGDPALSVKHSAIPTLFVSNPPRPSSFVLEQNYPNPFNPSTTIGYQLSANSFVILKVYDMLGREVRSLVNEPQGAGSHHITFNASGLASGVYLYRLQAGSFSATKKLLVLK